jgi:hypothetical protein
MNKICIFIRSSSTQKLIILYQVALVPHSPLKFVMFVLLSDIKSYKFIVNGMKSKGFGEKPSVV